MREKKMLTNMKRSQKNAKKLTMILVGNRKENIDMMVVW